MYPRWARIVSAEKPSRAQDLSLSSHTCGNCVMFTLFYVRSSCCSRLQAGSYPVNDGRSDPFSRSDARGARTIRSE